jgi:hypothetical protein
MNSFKQFIFIILFVGISVQQSRRRRNNQPPITRNIPIEMNNCPNGIQMRKEYRDMSANEWNSYRTALLKLQTSPSPDGGNYSEWDWLTRVHLDYVPFAHGYRHQQNFSI